VACHDHIPGPHAMFSAPSNSDSFGKEDGENRHEMG